ncbi:hypothetical protein GCM10011369_27550 [Neiella marina]|uniref:Uncharacterized protein n=1 Tax=Neiella marina TaxID=508461 RepID=A0A8J2U7B4_9GAMM|nr:hypothetical protein [Neiella marina]GGA84017.1 hypothetical protein GCM10011369_27550 [Neiella marina]
MLDYPNANSTRQRACWTKWLIATVVGVCLWSLVGLVQHLELQSPSLKLSPTVPLQPPQRLTEGFIPARDFQVAGSKAPSDSQQFGEIKIVMIEKGGISQVFVNVHLVFIIVQFNLREIIIKPINSAAYSVGTELVSI